MPGSQPQLKALRNRRQEQVRLHHRERGSNAQTRAASKREVGEAGETLGGLRGPAVGIELFGLFKEAGIAVQDPLAHVPR